MRKLIVRLYVEVDADDLVAFSNRVYEAGLGDTCVGVEKGRMYVDFEFEHGADFLEALTAARKRLEPLAVKLLSWAWL